MINLINYKVKYAQNINYYHIRLNILTCSLQDHFLEASKVSLNVHKRKFITRKSPYFKNPSIHEDFSWRFISKLKRDCMQQQLAAISVWSRSLVGGIVAKFEKASPIFYNLITFVLSLKLSERTKPMCLSDCSSLSKGFISQNLLKAKGRVKRL